MEKDLTGRVLEFQRSGQGLGEIVETLAERIYAFPRTARGWKEDDCGDFYLFFFPRLIKTLARFRDCGRPFECYLSAVLGWQLKSYLRRRRRSDWTWGASAQPRLWEGCPGLEAAESAPGDEDPLARTAAFLGLDGEGRVRRPSDRRRLLLLALKDVRSAGAADLERIAFWCGEDLRRLEEAAEELRRRLARQERRLERLRSRRNRAWSRLTLLEQELEGVQDPYRRRPLSEKAARLRHTLRAAQEMIARIPLRPSNRDLAEVLGLPKGTVDSALFWLRRRADRVEESKEYA